MVKPFGKFLHVNDTATENVQRSKTVSRFIADSNTRSRRNTDNKRYRSWSGIKYDERILFSLRWRWVAPTASYWKTTERV